jgi:CHASE2 domain-containing sensor protein
MIPGFAGNSNDVLSVFPDMAVSSVPDMVYVYSYSETPGIALHAQRASKVVHAVPAARFRISAR